MEIKIGQVLGKLIKERGMTIKALSKASGVPASNISEWISNRVPKNPSQVKKVAEALDTTLHFLLFGEEDNQEPLQKILKEDFFSGTFEIAIKRVKIKES